MRPHLVIITLHLIALAVASIGIGIWEPVFWWVWVPVLGAAVLGAASLWRDV